MTYNVLDPSGQKAAQIKVETVFADPFWSPAFPHALPFMAA